MASRKSSKAVGYVRRSRSRREKSLDNQKKAIRKYAAAHRVQVLKFFEDDVPGRRPK